ncbi:uncharacterized protein VP01_4742g1 [Puccinia sorghi]|uniref:Uncharacterized protein n=1 Tax=Puccinia sorghi TaxID=27349 RepID=A0A0L6UMW0_9BASI|nr:uncharacterized protein VP01_4742g1 [Puccinia sorghi]
MCGQYGGSKVLGQKYCLSMWCVVLPSQESLTIFSLKFDFNKRMFLQSPIFISQLSFHCCCQYSISFQEAKKLLQLVIEECIVLLKKRFQSLKALHIRVAGDKDMARVNAWIIMCGLMKRYFVFQDCTMMHNFLLHVYDCNFEEGEEGGSNRSAKTADFDADLTTTAGGKKEREDVLALASAFRAKQS